MRDTASTPRVPGRLRWGSRQTCRGTRKSWTGGSPKGPASGSWSGRGVKPSSPIATKIPVVRRGTEPSWSTPQTRSSSTIQRAESLDVNRRTCDTLGYAREELLPLSVVDLETVHLPGGVARLWRGLAPDEPVSTEGIHHPLERLKRGARTVAMRKSESWFPAFGRERTPSPGGG